METLWLWIGFNALVIGLLVLDLGVFHRKSHAVSVKEAAIWSMVWIGLALLFNACIYLLRGPDDALQFLTGYLIEKSLSVDNIFIFVLIFTSLSVPAAYQHRVLFWGVLGALVMRGLLILAGTALLETFDWIFYIFGAFLVITGVRMVLQKEKEVQPEKNPALRLVRRLVPVTETYEKERFFVRQAGKLMVTPLFLTLVVIEVTDLVFAVDSIPAIFAVTRDPFLVYTSNVFAILGLRSLYFVFAGIVEKFYYLKIALAIILVSVGAKMLIAEWYHVPSWLSLVVIVVVLGVALLASFIRARREARTRPH
ncbi:MAG TPA: TerC family protein [Ktedonobacteraceae bacterium]|nr:TerC family protein [Ktedonobacteraceae bacterium]